MTAHEQERRADRSAPPDAVHAIDEKWLRETRGSVGTVWRRLLKSLEGLPDGLQLAPYDPNAIFKSFPHLRLEAGYRLASYQYLDGRGNGNGFVFVIPVGRQLPPPPPGEDWPMSSNAGTLPRWVCRDVMRRLEGDGSPLSYFEASLFVREVHELGAMWHGSSWGDHAILTSAPTLEPSSSGTPWEWREKKPETFAPVVQEWTDGKKRAEFYTRSDYEHRAVYRHRDSYRKTYRPRCTVSMVACGGEGYVH